MSLPLFIAGKYLRSNKNSQLISLISVITILGITVGVTVLILSITVLNSFEEAIEEKIVNFNEHIVITGFGNRNLPESEQVEETIKSSLGFYLQDISPFISKNVIISSKNVTDGVEFIGLDSTGISRISPYLIISSDSAKSSVNKVFVGEKLRRRLNININDVVTLFALQKDELPSLLNPPMIKQFNVNGIYESGMAQYDDLRIYSSIHAAKVFLGFNHEISGYNIQLKEISKLDSLEEVLKQKLSYPYYVQSIYKKHQNIFTWIDLQKKPIPIILGIIIIVAAFNIIGTILMIILERTGDIGILKSLGMNRLEILKVFMYHGLYLSIMGIISGNILALAITFLQQNFNLITLPGSVYFLSSVPVSVQPIVYASVSLITLTICMITTVIPSFIAGRLNIINAIRFQ
ncbi:MAG: ABC transporter permease [Melioribacteraceae bacterium]|nr:ABC transporter permease [Melioribacteraceae bacterium]